MTKPRPPIAQRHTVSSVHHGVTLNDDYAWLRADNWQEVIRDPSLLADEIRRYLDAENAYAEAALADVTELRADLVAEMKGRIKQDESSVPMADGPYAYGTRFVPGAEHPQIVRQARNAAIQTDETLDSTTLDVMLDGNSEAAGCDYFRLGGASHSPDHRYLCWGADTRGSEYFTLKVRDLETGEDLEDAVLETAGSGVWAADSKTFFYTRLDDNHRPSKVYRHVVGEPAALDVLVYEENDSGFFVGVGKTQSGAYVLIESHDHQTSEVYLIDAHAPTSKPVLIAKRDLGVEYSVEHRGDVLWILTNADDSEDFKIVQAPLAAPGRDNWQDVVPHEAGRLILSLTVYQDHMVWLERYQGLPQIMIRSFDTGDQQPIAFAEEAYSLGMSDGYEFDAKTLRFTYSSMTTPSQVFDYHIATKERSLLKQQEVPSGHRASDYVTRRLFVRAQDGEEIPISLLHHKDTPLDGSAPALLYGYGAYGISIPASFSTNVLSLVDRGFVYAIAHIRGGQDKGYRWYRLGKEVHKENTFRDFIACARHLIDHKITSADRLIAQGGSAGGMLMGAIANQAPDLFAGIIAEVPFVDVLNTMLDDTLPLTPPEWPEWGNPIADEEAFARIKRYSPYDNVAAISYPSILVVAGLTDPRVTYWEPAKWVAKLRASKVDDNPLLLRTNMGAGHGGQSGRFARLDEIAVNYAFALKTAGVFNVA